MEPSKYQQAILEWLRSGTGHGCCNAVAGAGKTTVLRSVLESRTLQRYLEVTAEQKRRAVAGNWVLSGE